MALFGKKNKTTETQKDEKTQKQIGTTPEEFRNVSNEEQAVSAPTALPKDYGVLNGFYISEKATGLVPLSQYVFKVFRDTTKNEIKKQVERSFNVKVRGVKVINLPRKTRTTGRHRGFKKGFKKAIVVLEKGQTIDSAKA